MEDRFCSAMFLGPPRFQRESVEIRVRLRKAVALVAYLGVEHRGFSRDYLAALLWPDHPQSSSLADLRRTLSVLRRVLGAECIRSEGDLLALDDRHVRLDTEEFASIVGDPEAVEDTGQLARGAALYRGPFLEGFNLGSCEKFDLWQDGVRQRLQMEFAGLLKRLSRAHLSAGHPRLALPHVQRWLEIDTWSQEAQRTLMETLARAGQRRAAIEQFESYAQTLQDEGIDLDDETAEIYQAIFENRLGTVDSMPVADAERRPESNPDWVLAGRTSEIEDLDRAWSDTMNGRGRVVMITGEAGIGKTTLAREYCRRISTGTVRVVSSRLREGFDAPPYWPWIQLLSQIRRGAEDGPDGPTGHTGSASLPAMLGIDPDSSQVWLFDTVQLLLSDTSKKSQLVLLLDNFELADEASVDLLGYLAAGIDTEHILVIVTMRAETGADAQLARLRAVAACPGYRHIVLKGLSREDTRTMLGARLGSSLEPRLVDAVFDRTRGHPLFVEETVRILRASPEPADFDETPERLRLAIGARLDGLTADAREYLSIAAVLGDDTQTAVVAAVAGPRDPAEIKSSLLACVVSGFLEPADGGAVRFRHGLMRDVVYRHIAPDHRYELHEKAGDILRARPDADQHAEDIAEHYSHAVTAAGRAEHKRWACRAGFNSLRARAYHGALSHFRKVADRDDFEIRDPVDAEILAGTAVSEYELARLYLSPGETGDVGDSLRRIADYYISHDDKKGLARFVTQTEDLWFHTTGEAVQKRILRHLPESVAVTLSTFPLQHDARLTARAVAYHRRFLVKAVRVGDAKREYRARLRLVRIKFFSNNFAGAFRDSARLAAMMESRATSGHIPHDPDAGHTGFDFTAWYRASRGEIGKADRSALAFLETARRIGWTRSVVLALLTCTMLARSRGDLAAARAYVSEAAELSPNDPRILLLKALDELETGDSDRAGQLGRNYLKEEGVSRSYPTSLFAIGPLALFYRVTGDPAYAETARSIHAGLGWKGPAEMLHDTATTGFALVAAADGDAERAARYFRILRRYPRRMTGGLLVSSDRVLGLLSAARGRSAQACFYFRRAVRFCSRGLTPDLAWTLYDYASTLLARRTFRRRRRAVQFLAQSEALAGELGMKLLAGYAADLREQA
jgi:DNA-binding SARP family transcriptional activator